MISYYMQSIEGINMVFTPYFNDSHKLLISI